MCRASWRQRAWPAPYDVIARAQAQDIDKLARLVASRVQALDGVWQTMGCPVVHR
jgi:DNA-binding Lrp family transcriptional regulator